ncbi:MAG TPA: hypothetical protein VL971_10275 [Rhizomicrobium sp.]|nr:hypothetical protein [Rhizomicrobium sp.]
MKHFIFAATATAFLFSPAFAAPGERAIPVKAMDEVLYVPANSPLHFRDFGDESAAEFDGAVELSGTWYFGGTPDDPDAGPALEFVPDSASLARLPRYKTRGQPGDIFITNPGDFVHAVLSPADQAKADKKGAKYLSGKIDIWVDQFEAGVECDAPFFNAHFLRVARPPMRVALKDMPDEGC